MYPDDAAAALYDQLNPWGEGHPGDRFYNELVRSADDVLDVGCGTGSMLHWARDHGHPGRLVGIDPDRAMLARAETRTDIEWVLGTAADIPWKREFDLATMASNAFQCLVEDADIRASLTAIRGALRDGGRFAFETRHIGGRGWEAWNPANSSDIVDADDRPLCVWHEVESVVRNVVTFTETTADADGTVLRVDRTSLRFFDAPTIRSFLDEAGFAVESQYGDWDRSPVTDTSRLIVTIARPAR